MRRAVVTFLLLSLLGAVALAATPIRVLLADESGPVTVLMNEGHRGFIDGDFRFETPVGLSWPLQAHDGQLESGDLVLGHSLTLEGVSGTVSWQGRRYRGALRFSARGDGIRVINVVDLESYLQGVVPAEMQASWPLEALKAQAVAARSYILASLHPDEEYDVCATVDCQVYLGLDAEHPRSNRAVSETAGVVLTYDGDFARTYYHADSGGGTASSAEVWGLPLPYLVARTDVAGSSPHRRWEKRLDPKRMAASLRELGCDVGAVTAMRPLAYSESGRVQRMEISGSAGRTVLEGSILTAQLRGWGLKSTRFAMVAPLTARGDGWGHGVGMSQYGARALAQASHDYSQILAFYYPSTSLQRLLTDEPQAARR